jgi:hypothetical protein
MECRAALASSLPNGCVAELIIDDKPLGQLKLSLNGLAERFDKLP